MKRNKRSKAIMALSVILILLITMCIPAYGAELSDLTEVNLFNFLPAELLIIAVVVYCIAEFVKKTEKVPSWAIPIFVLILAILITVLYTAVVLDQGFAGKTIVNGIVYGVIIASIAVYCNQLIKQIFVKRLE